MVIQEADSKHMRTTGWLKRWMHPVLQAFSLPPPVLGSYWCSCSISSSVRASNWSNSYPFSWAADKHPACIVPLGHCRALSGPEPGNRPTRITQLLVSTGFTVYRKRGLNGSSVPGLWRWLRGRRLEPWSSWGSADGPGKNVGKHSFSSNKLQLDRWRKADSEFILTLLWNK